MKGQILNAPPIVSGRDTLPYGICRGCGNDIPPGGPRRIGICVWCVAADKFTPRRIPVPRYGRRSDSESEPIPE